MIQGNAKSDLAHGWLDLKFQACLLPRDSARSSSLLQAVVLLITEQCVGVVQLALSCKASLWHYCFNGDKAVFAPSSGGAL